MRSSPIPVLSFASSARGTAYASSPKYAARRSEPVNPAPPAYQPSLQALPNSLAWNGALPLSLHLHIHVSRSCSGVKPRKRSRLFTSPHEPSPRDMKRTFGLYLRPISAVRSASFDL